jgi:uncharacterized protein (DUF305 family)
MSLTRYVAAVAALAAATAVSACSSSTAPTNGHDGHATHSVAEAATQTSVRPAVFNSDDVAFATGMIPHHQQAVELSALVAGRTANPVLIELAKQISAAQEPEIVTMQDFLEQWNHNPPETTADSGHGDHAGTAMSGMVDAATTSKLPTLSGAEFDTLWLQSMVGHHEGAVEMSQTELAKGQNAGARKLAQGIIDAQQGEIAQMRQMLGRNP